MFGFSLISVVLVASQVVAIASPAPFSHTALSNILSTRQSVPTIPSSSIPDQCQSDCKAMLNTANTCTTGVDCLCTEAVGNAFVQCESCLVGLPGVTEGLKSLAQDGLDALTSTCKDAGHPFSKPLTVSAKGGALSVSPSVAFAVLSTVAGFFVVAA